MQVSQKFHNTMLVFKDGRGGPIPPYMEFGEATWLEPLGYARSIARNYAGCDWVRHILEMHGWWYLVMDELITKEVGWYDSRCLWRAVGRVALREEERLLCVEQDGPTMELRAAPGFSAPVELVLKEEPQIWGTWDRYPYNEGRPTVQVLQERASATLGEGQRLAFFNLFGTNGPYPPLERLGEGLVRLAGEEPALVGLGAELAGHCGVNTDAAFIYLSQRQILLASASHARVDEHELVCSSAPVTLRLDLEGGRAQVSALQAVELALDGGNPLTLPAGVHNLPLPVPVGLPEALRAALARPAPSGSGPRSALAERLGLSKVGRCLWQVKLPDGQEPSALVVGPGGLLYVGTASGDLFRLGDGQASLCFSASGRVNSVAVADVNSDGQAEIIVGSADHHVYLLDKSGQELWRHELPYYLHEPTVEVVMAGDFGPQGKAVVAGSNNCHVHALSPESGRELWRCEVIHGVNDMTSADMNGDGVEEILAVTEWWTFQCIDSSGEGLWPYWAVRPHYAPGANVVRAADIDGDGRPEMLVGAIDTCAYAFNAAGERLWEFFTGEEISALECLDVNDDGVPEVLAASLNGYLYALDGKGQELWHLGLEEEIQALTLVSGGARVAAAVAGPWIYIVAPDGTLESCIDCGFKVRLLQAARLGTDMALCAVGADGSVAAFAPAT